MLDTEDPELAGHVERDKHMSLTSNDSYTTEQTKLAVFDN